MSSKALLAEEKLGLWSLPNSEQLLVEARERTDSSCLRTLGVVDITDEVLESRGADLARDESVREASSSSFLKNSLVPPRSSPNPLSPVLASRALLASPLYEPLPSHFAAVEAEDASSGLLGPGVHIWRGLGLPVRFPVTAGDAVEDEAGVFIGCRAFRTGVVSGAVELLARGPSVVLLRNTSADRVLLVLCSCRPG